MARKAKTRRGKKQYGILNGARLTIDPQLAGEELERIRKANGNVLTPAIVLAHAVQPDSPLHDAFEWNDAKAAQARREDQACYLLRNITVVIAESPSSRPVRAFVIIQTHETTAHTSIQVALASPDMRAQLLERAKKELSNWRQRYKELEELAAVFAAIEGLK
jgi:hypothetical protein